MREQNEGAGDDVKEHHDRNKRARHFADALDAAKTNEPVREGLVAGLALLNPRHAVEAHVGRAIPGTRGQDDQRGKRANDNRIDKRFETGHETLAEPVLLIVQADENPATGQSRHRISGAVAAAGTGFEITWQEYAGESRPGFTSDGFYQDHVGATLTAKAFDTVKPGLGKWLITIASWLFAISTIIAWGYYGEQGVIYIAGNKGVLPFNIVYCALTFVATLGHIKTSTDLDNLTGIGLGVIIYTNLPILWIFGYQAMRAYRDYVARLKSGQLDTDAEPPTLDELFGPAKN